MKKKGLRRKESIPPIVALGASAGGLQALTGFLRAMPSDSGLSFVIVQHLDPKHPSLMVELLARETRMRVAEAQEGALVEANRVYVIPPGKFLTVRKGTLHVECFPAGRLHRVPIDAFFRALASDQRERAIGIVLSGTGSEGALGLQEIKNAGGLAIVQDPETAGHPEMPKFAIATSAPDFVLKVEQMPEVLLRYAAQPYVRSAEKAPEVGRIALSGLPAVLSLLHGETGHDFSMHKQKTIGRRLNRRLRLVHVQDVNEYLQLLRRDPNEVKALFRDFLVGVSGFFRDPKAWAALEEQAIIPLVRETADDQPIRVWVPGCASGEEAYSIAMLVFDCFQKEQKKPSVQIFATDIDEEALQLARAAVYPSTIAADIPVEKLHRFFDQTAGGYQVIKPIRDSVIFAAQDLLGDAPFSKMDLISCRNLLIYLNPDIQRKIITLFHFSLREGGYLLLGNVETIGQQDDLFRTLSKKWHIYRRIGPTRRDRVEFPLRIPATTGQAHGAAGGTRADFGNDPRLGRLAEQLILETFSPACVLINRKGEILHYQGATGDYLGQPGGPPTQDLFACAKDDLRLKLRGAVQKAIRGAAPIQFGSRIQRGNETRAVEVRVIPLEGRKEVEGLLLVSFNDRVANEEEAHTPAEAADHGYVKHLEEDLRETREELQSTIEQLETNNEELKASNEEIMSMNEELQSGNEELETSKEELQSLNEELSTVNSELETKVAELESKTNDLNNLLLSTNIATLFLDERFAVRRFTPPASRLFSLIDTDIGRPILDITWKFTDPSLMDDARRVLGTLVPIEREVRSKQGRFYLRQILPYRTGDNRIDGVVVTFFDVAGEALQEARLFSDAIVETIQEPLLVLDGELRAVSANRAFLETFRLTRKEVEGRPIFELGKGEWDIPALRQGLDQVWSRKAIRDFEVSQTFGRIGFRTLALNGRILSRPGKRPDLILLAMEDITDRRRAEAAAHENEERFQLMADSLPILLSFVGTDRRYHFNNAAYEDWFGIPRGRLAGRHVRSLIGEQAYRSVEASLRKALSGENVEYEGVLRYKGAGLRQVHVNYVPHRDAVGKVDGVYVVITDVSRLKKVEESLREEKEQFATILHAAGDGIISIDQRGTVESFNPAAERMFGYPAADVINRNVKMLMPSPYREEHDGYLSRYLRTGKQRIIGMSREVLGRRKDGSTFPLELMINQHHDGQGFKFTGIVRDISRRKDLEKQFADLADEEQRRLGQELHDTVGQQITGIEMLAASLCKDLNRRPSPEQRTARLLLRSVADTKTMLRRLMRGLAAADIDARGFKTALESLVERCRALYKTRIHLRYGTNVAMRDPLAAAQLLHIAQESIHNAVRHGRAGNLWVSVTRSRGRIRLTVRDDGRGFSKKGIEESEGLGIRIMKYRAGLLGATLEIDQRKGSGVIVSCTLP